MRKKSRSEKIKIFLFSFMVIIFSCILLLFTGYRKITETPRNTGSPEQEGVNLSLRQIYQTATKDGAPAWKLNAASVSYMNGKQQAVFEKPVLTFFLQNAREARLEAGRGTVKTDSSDLRMDGNVIMENEDYILRTQELKYRHDRRIFFSDVPVRISGKDMELSADSATLDLSAGKVFFKGHVQGVFADDISL
ncbi:MAG: LPS export ABC transporter periplasmic protein LptC [Desulfococcaceae bacterium]|nr:LPS export ABC transporter periplasmic protein LptC [Desulfococcaceae bacterium]